MYVNIDILKNLQYIKILINNKINKKIEIYILV